MAGGSQIIISKDGIRVITPREFKVHAGQHVFKGGEKVINNLPNLPSSNLEGFNHGFNLMSDENIGNLPFKLFNSKRSYQFNANLDEQQRTQFVQTGNEAEKLELKYSGDEEINHQWKEE